MKPDTIIRKLKQVSETTVPCNVSAKKVKHMIKEEIKSGKISIGHCVNPKTYVKFTMKNGIVSTSELFPHLNLPLTVETQLI